MHMSVHTHRIPMRIQIACLGAYTHTNAGVYTHVCGYIHNAYPCTHTSHTGGHKGQQVCR